MCSSDANKILEESGLDLATGPGAFARSARGSAFIDKVHGKSFGREVRKSLALGDPGGALITEGQKALNKDDDTKVTPPTPATQKAATEASREEQEEARRRAAARQAQARAAGRQGTIATSPLGVDQRATTSNKSLLGQ